MRSRTQLVVAIPAFPRGPSFEFFRPALPESRPPGSSVIHQRELVFDVVIEIRKAECPGILRLCRCRSSCPQRGE